jgi:hypothetical protein
MIPMQESWVEALRLEALFFGSAKSFPGRRAGAGKGTELMRVPRGSSLSAPKEADSCHKE